MMWLYLSNYVFISSVMKALFSKCARYEVYHKLQNVSNDAPFSSSIVVKHLKSQINRHSVMLYSEIHAEKVNVSTAYVHTVSST